MARTPRILVVGGGLAGLATARALLRYGIEPEVVERATAWSQPGAGMYLPANSVRALGALGVETALRGGSHEITRQQFLDHRGRMLLDMDLATVWGPIGPCVSIGHQDLHALLREGISVRMGTTVTTLQTAGAQVHAVFDDGSSSDYDVVVGADGIRSSIRSMAFAGAAPMPVGQASWRFIVEGNVESSAWRVRLGRRRAFLTIPLGGGRLYCYADVDVTDPVDPTGGDPERFAGSFGEFAEPVPALIARAAASGVEPYFSLIEEVAQDTWVKERVVLVGDAAHAMSPNMAQGAGMAFEDALVLAETIAGGRPLEDFVARRRPRVAFVQKQTHRRDRTRNLPSAIRNATLRLMGRRIFRGNYEPLLEAP